MKVYVNYSFEIVLPDELVDKMPEDEAKELARKLAQNINFQIIQRAYIRNPRTSPAGLIPSYDVYITRVRSSRIEDW